MQSRDGGPAFPPAGVTVSGPDGQPMRGLSLRDWFAGQALAGAIACPSTYVGNNDRDQKFSAAGIARFAFFQADAMLAAREVRS